MTPYEKIVAAIKAIDDPEFLGIQLKLVEMELATTNAAKELRADFTNETAKSLLITKFFFPYDIANPEDKKAMRDELDDIGKKYLDAWSFAGLYNYPYRDAVASIYLNSIAGKSDEDFATHIQETESVKQLLIDKIESLQTPSPVV